jgi:nucleoside-diphosphate-sugar epimerase
MILVTGATGLVGSRLLFDLIASGQSVRAMKRSGSRMTRVNACFAGREDLARKIEWVEGDITDVFSLEAALIGINRVYHCAAIVSFQPSDHKRMLHVNITGTANVVNLCLASGIEKLCYVSSVAALGRISGSDIIDENSVWKSSQMNSGYAVSKYGAEREVWRGIAEGLSAVIVNPGVIIGPGNWKTDSSMLFTRVARGLRFYTRGSTGFVDLEDVTRAMIQLMDSEVSGQRFILVSENVPFRDVMNRIADTIGVSRPDIYAGPLLSGFAWRMELLRGWVTGKKPVITKETARSATNRFCYSSDKIRKEFGFKFRPVMEAIDRTAEKFNEGSDK